VVSPSWHSLCAKPSEIPEIPHTLCQTRVCSSSLFWLAVAE